MVAICRVIASSGLGLLLVLAVGPAAWARETPAETPVEPAAVPGDFDPALAAQVGADEYGMRGYVLVVLKTGPTPLPEGDARRAMFAGHFANMTRLSEAGTLVIAGPFTEDPAGWRGLFVLAVDDIDAARRLVATDPVIAQGEMVAEYHRWYGSAAAMLLPDLHGRVARQSP